MNLWPDEAARRAAFPVCASRIFLAHAAVTVLPQVAAEAMQRYAATGAHSHQEDAGTWRDVKATRETGARLVGAGADEIALLGPTALGLSLIANGLDWQPGDEVVCYGEDYPANVYPWLALARLGVTVRRFQPERLGEITPELVAATVTDRTRLVTLSTAHYLSGYRPDIAAIGALLHARGILLALDAIQTLGAFPLASQHVDFLAADAHKWMLGPNAIGLLLVRREHFDRLRPTLLGAWNVHSPGFIAQEEIRFPPSAQRYEPGVLNFIGMYGMKAALDLLLATGIETIAARLLELKAHLVTHLDALGFEVLGPRSGPHAHAITSVHRPGTDHAALHARLLAAGIVCSHRSDRSGRDYLRFSPHFYNTEAELDRVAEVLRQEPG